MTISQAFTTAYGEWEKTNKSTDGADNDIGHCDLQIDDKPKPLIDLDG